MKIVFLSDDFPPQSFGGAGISTYELAAGMRNAGHEVFVITTCRRGEDTGRFSYMGVEGWRIVSNYPARWRAYKSLYNKSVVLEVENLLAHIRPEVVHANNIHFHLSYYCLKLAKQYAQAVLFTARDTMTFTYGKLETKRYKNYLDTRTSWLDHFKQGRKRWNPFRNSYIKHYLRFADRICAVSDALRNALLQNGIKPVETVHTGVDVAAWRTLRSDANHFRVQQGLVDRKIVFLGGRLSAAKGVYESLEAFAILLKTDPDALLVMAGNIDDYTEVMKEKAKRLGIDRQVTHVGWITGDELKKVYAAADVVLVPSLYLDPLPRVALEAMASGKPVVASCYGGAKEVVLDGVTGYIVNPFDHRMVAEKLSLLLRNASKAVAFGLAGQKRIMDVFNLDMHVRTYERLYQEILRRAV